MIQNNILVKITYDDEEQIHKLIHIQSYPQKVSVEKRKSCIYFLIDLFFSVINEAYSCPLLFNVVQQKDVVCLCFLNYKIQLITQNLAICLFDIYLKDVILALSWGAQKNVKNANYTVSVSVL